MASYALLGWSGTERTLLLHVIPAQDIAMPIEHEGHSPQIHSTARVAPNATLCGYGAAGLDCSG